MSPGEFTVWQFFANNDAEEVASRVDAETAVRVAKNLTESIGGQIGTTERVIIASGDDTIAFEWCHAEGVVFPPPPQATRDPSTSPP